MIIKSSVRDYQVHFHQELSDSLKEAVKVPGLVTVVDARVYGLYKSVIDGHIKGPIFQITALEENKSYEKSGDYIRELLGAGCRKSTHLLVIGGGIIQDIGGFMASIISRGIEWTLVPTTLLAQCDSCIGSKTSMNIAKFKNQLGTFYPPSRVLISASVLNTLAKQDLYSGVCEALKLAMIEGEEATARMAGSLEGGLNPKAFAEIVRQSLEIKKVFIEEDEFDRGRRNLLNYGHTFGHAFESASGYKIPHGVAVGIGIIAANFFSWKLEIIGEAEYKKAVALMMPWCAESMPDLKGLSAEVLMAAMKTDKKSSANQIGFILTKGFGKTERSFLPFEQSQELLADWLMTV